MLLSAALLIMLMLCSSLISPRCILVAIPQALGSPDAMENIVRALSYYCVTNLEAFMFCYAGEYMINKVSDRRSELVTKWLRNFLRGSYRESPYSPLPLQSKAIGYAAYNTAWYDMQPKHCRILMFIILRSQKQLTLTVGKLTDLSLQCFASVSDKQFP